MNYTTGKVRRILRLAAKLIASGEQTFCCYAMREAADQLKDFYGYYEIRAENHFVALFGPTLHFGVIRDPGAEFWNKFDTPHRREQRCLALLFAAESFESSETDFQLGDTRAW
jgi:hypothetical protein